MLKHEHRPDARTGVEKRIHAHARTHARTAQHKSTSLTKMLMDYAMERKLSEIFDWSLNSNRTHFNNMMYHFHHNAQVLHQYFQFHFVLECTVYTQIIIYI